VIDISSLAAGEEDVIARFHYYDASWEWWWQVDDVLLGLNLGCQPQPGSIVVGNVYDDNTQSPLVGAMVRTGEGAEVTTVTAPSKSGLDDGFFLLFMPEGSGHLSATLGSGYGPATDTFQVPDGGAQRQDLFLPAGLLEYSPQEFTVVLTQGMTTTLPLTLSNRGGLDLQFELIEQEVGFTPDGPAQSLKVLIPGSDQAFGPHSKYTKRHASRRPDISFTVEQVQRPGDSVKVLLLTPDDAANGDISLITSSLAAFPDLDVVLWDGSAGVPAVGELLAYDVVIVGNDIRWSQAGLSPSSVGNVLADYLDAGGRLIDTLFIHDYEGWQLEGRYITGGYSPFTSSSADLSAVPYSLGTVYEPSHAILAGVHNIVDSPATGIGHQDVGLAPGATRLADWDDGHVFVAYTDQVVGVNQLWFHGSNWIGDVPQLMHNAILYLARGDVDWLATDPISGTVPSGGQVVASLAYDSAASSVTEAGTYRALLQLENDTPYGNSAIPVSLKVVAAPACTDVLEVDLSLLTGGIVLTDTVVEFSASIRPSNFSPPFNFSLDYGQGAPVVGEGVTSPLTFDHIFPEPGYHQVRIDVWNCRLTQGDAVSDSVEVVVFGGSRMTYVPLVLKGGR
jgi:hypothetical protein